MIDLYTWSTPNGRKVSILLEELAMPYTVHPINITKDEQFDPAFLKFSPNNKIPAIIDRDTGRGMMESAAIMIYLCEKAKSPLYPSGDGRYPVLEWLMMQMGSVGPMLGQVHHFSRFAKEKIPYAIQRYEKEAQRLYGVLDRRLGEEEWLAGAYSIADIATWPWISRYEWQGIDMNKFPNVKRWYMAMADRPAVQKGYDVPETGAAIPRP